MQPVKSPYVPNDFSRELTPERMDAIVKLLGSECVFVAMQKEKCSCEKICKGHFIECDSIGFTTEAIPALLQRIVTAQGK